MTVVTTLGSPIESVANLDVIDFVTNTAIPANSTVFALVWTRSNSAQPAHVASVTGAGLDWILDQYEEGPVSGGVSLYRALNPGGAIASPQTIAAPLTATQNRNEMLVVSIPGQWSPDKKVAATGNDPTVTPGPLAALTAADFVLAVAAQFPPAADTAPSVSGWTELYDSHVENPGSSLHAMAAYRDSAIGATPEYNPTTANDSNFAALAVAYMAAVTGTTISPPVGTGSGTGFAPLLPRVQTPPKGLGGGSGISPSISARVLSPAGGASAAGLVPLLFVGAVPNIQPPVGHGAGVGHAPSIIGAVKPPGLKLYRQGTRLVLEYA